MRFADVRRVTFQLHMWIGLALGILFALLGLSGSALVYEDGFANLLDPPPKAVAQGKSLSLQDLIATAWNQADGAMGSISLFLPDRPGQAVLVRFGQMSRMGNMPGMESSGVEYYLDPVNGAVLQQRSSVLPPVLIFVHQLHGNFLMGGAGRILVGWLGVALLGLGLTGLVLWWPKRGHWKYAFGVRRAAKGLRFQRELHAAVGLWTFIFFMLVSFTGLALAFPVTAARLTGSPSAARTLVAPHIPAGFSAIDPDASAALARTARPNLKLRSLVLPSRPDRAVTAILSGPGTNPVTVWLDPYRSRILSVQVPEPPRGVLAWQRPIHSGQLLGPVWRFLVFVSGLLPLLFLVTGVIMWVAKYRRRLAMNEPLDDALADQPVE